MIHERNQQLNKMHDEHAKVVAQQKRDYEAKIKKIEGEAKKKAEDGMH